MDAGRVSLPEGIARNESNTILDILPALPAAYAGFDEE